MSEPVYRRATLEDIPQVATVFIEARTKCLAFLNWEYHQDIMVGVFTRRLSDTEMWVAEVEGQVVGFIDLLPSEIEDLYIHPDFHGRGLGSALLKIALERIDGTARLWVFQENSPARAFYEKHGFAMELETDGADNMERCPDARYVRFNS